MDGALRTAVRLDRSNHASVTTIEERAFANRADSAHASADIHLDHIQDVGEGVSEGISAPPRMNRGLFRCMRSAMTAVFKEGVFFTKYLLNRKASVKDSLIQQILTDSQRGAEDPDGHTDDRHGVSASAVHAIHQYQKISELLHHSLTMMDCHEDSDASLQDQAHANFRFVESLSDVIRSGANNEGIRCFRLLIALADNQEKVLDEFANTQQENTGDISLERQIITFLKQHALGDDNSNNGNGNGSSDGHPVSALHADMKAWVLPLLDAIKQMKSFNSLVIMVNHYSAEGLKSTLLEKMQGYTQKKGGGWFRPVNNGIDQFIKTACQDVRQLVYHNNAERPAGFDLLGKVYEGLVKKGRAQDEITESQAITSISDVASRQNALQLKMNQTLNVVTALAEIVNQFMSHYNDVAQRHASIKQLRELFLDHQNQQLLKFILEVISEKLLSVTEASPRADSLFDEMCDWMPAFYKPAMTLFVNEFAEQGGAAIVVLNGLLSRIDNRQLEAIVTDLTVFPDNRRDSQGGKSSGEITLELLSRMILNQPNAVISNDVGDDEGLLEQGVFSIAQLAAMGYRLLDCFHEDEKALTDSADESYGSAHLTHQLSNRSINQLANLIRGSLDKEAQEEWVALLRNLLSQPDFSVAFDTLKERVPAFLQHNLDRLKEDLLLEKLANISKNLVPLMSSESIVRYLKMIPDACVEAVRVTVRDTLNHIGQKHNNLNTALCERSERSRQAILSALSSPDAALRELADLISHPAGEKRFLDYVYQNNVLNGFSDETYSHIPDRQRVPMLFERTVLIQLIQDLKNLIEANRSQSPEEALSGLVRLDTLTIDQVLGATASSLLGVDTTHTAIDANVQSVIHAIDDMQMNVVSQMTQLMGQMGVMIDFKQLSLVYDHQVPDSNRPVLNNSKVRLGTDQDNIQQGLQDQWMELRSLLARYSLSRSIQATVAKVAPVYSTDPQVTAMPVTTSALGHTVIDFEDRLKAAKNTCQTLGLLSPSTRVMMTEAEQIQGLWGFTCDILADTDVVQIYQRQQSDGRLFIDEEGEASLVVINVDGSVVDENGVTFFNGSEESECYKQRLDYNNDLAQAMIEARMKMRQTMLKYFDTFIALLLNHNTTDSLDVFLERAGLPPSVKKMLASMISDVLPADVVGSEISRQVLLSILDYPIDLKGKFVNVLPDDALDSIMSQFTQLVNTIDPYVEMPFFKQFAKSLVASLTEAKAIQQVAGELTKEYYKVMPHCDKRSLAEAVLGLGQPKLNEKGEILPEFLMALVSAMSQASGPCYQKAMQLFKGDITSLPFKKALDKMESEVFVRPQGEVIQQIEAAIGGIKDAEGYHYRLLTERELKSNDFTDQFLTLGSATIAQANIVNIYKIDADNNTMGEPLKAAAKIRRPFIKHRTLREINGLKSIPDLTNSIRGTLVGLGNSIIKETNFNQEYDFSELMQTLYQATDETGEAVALLSAKMIGLNDSLLLQHYVQGKKPTEIWHRLNEGEDEAETDVVLSIRDKVQFLGALGDRLQLLVSQFAASAFLGDVHEKAITQILFVQDRPEQKDSSHNATHHKNCILIQPVSIAKDEIQVLRYRLHYYDRYGVLSREVPVDESNNQLMHLLDALKDNNLSIASKSQLANELRSVLKINCLFEGESFIDSDRHIGNILYERGDSTSLQSESKTAQLKCIDTGAGAIVTEFERAGMVKLAAGITMGHVDIVMAGLKQLIPDIDDSGRYQTRAFTESGMPFDYDSLKFEIDQSINLKNVAHEKQYDIYSYLLSQGIVDFEMTQTLLFAELDTPEYAALKQQILDFSDPERVVDTVHHYLQSRIDLDSALSAQIDMTMAKALRQDMQKKIESANYHRAINYDGTLTDGENTLLLIKSLRKISNILTEFDIYAPEPIIQLNRGAKFVEDLVKRVNLWKASVRDEVDQINQHPHQSSIPLSAEERYALRHLDIGDAYRDGLIDGGDQLYHALMNAWHHTDKLKMMGSIPKQIGKVGAEAGHRITLMAGNSMAVARNTQQVLISHFAKTLRVVADFKTRISHQRQDGLIRGTLAKPALYTAGVLAIGAKSNAISKWVQPSEEGEEDHNV